MRFARFVFFPALLTALCLPAAAFALNTALESAIMMSGNQQTGVAPQATSSVPGMGASASNRGTLYPDPNSVLGGQPMPPALAAPPAWAQGVYPYISATGLPPFGASLFQGNFSSSYHDSFNPGYVVQPGDRIAVRIWGSKAYDDILVVDQQGNIFFPEIGPMRVAGLNNGQLQAATREKVASMFTDNVNIYTNLLSAQPVAIFVTGHVNKPGRYAGGPEDPVLYYLDRAGGINPERGSYRNVSIMRNGKILASLDLYDFMLKGNLPAIKLQQDDVILVQEKGMSVGALGLIRQPARYEFNTMPASGAALTPLVSPLPSASHISVSGTRDNASFHAYLSKEEFASFSLRDGDAVEFHADSTGDTIMVGAAGAIDGASRFPVKKGTTLKQLLSYVAVEPELVDLGSIYIQRRSVAQQQKQAILDSLRRLEQNALTASMSTGEEAAIRTQEAKLISEFSERASKLQPDGVLVVARGKELADVTLEEGDIVYLPQKTNVVLVSGEVNIPKAVAFMPRLSLRDYVKSAGGFSNKANTSTILIARANGEVTQASGGNILPGDQIIVMPSYASKGLPIIKDLTTLLYQIAVSTKIALDI